MKTIVLRVIILCWCASVLCGCSTTNISKLATALAKDPATVHVRITSIYGVLEYSRTNPTTNSPSHTVAPDGTITITKPAVQPITQ